MAGKAIERTYNAPHDRVLSALVDAITDLRYQDVRRDPIFGTIEYRTGWSIWTRGVQQMTAVIRSEGASSVISLKGHGISPVLITWGEKKRLARKVLRRVERRLSQSNE
jgi:hypothetical protein